MHTHTSMHECSKKRGSHTCTQTHTHRSRVAVEMRAHLCRLLLYLPSAKLHLKLQLQNLCHFSPTHLQSFENICIWMFFFLGLFVYLFCCCFFFLLCFVFVSRYCCVNAMQLKARRGAERVRKRSMRQRDERKRWGKWIDAGGYCEHTKSYFHQFAEVEINTTLAYLFHWLYFWVISRQMTRWGLVCVCIYTCACVCVCACTLVHISLGVEAQTCERERVQVAQLPWHCLQTGFLTALNEML